MSIKFHFVIGELRGILVTADHGKLPAVSTLNSAAATARKDGVQRAAHGRGFVWIPVGTKMHAPSGGVSKPLSCGNCLAGFKGKNPERADGKPPEVWLTSASFELALRLAAGVKLTEDQRKALRDFRSTNICTCDDRWVDSNLGFRHAAAALRVADRAAEAVGWQVAVDSCRNTPRETERPLWDELRLDQVRLSDLHDPAIITSREQRQMFSIEGKWSDGLRAALKSIFVVSTTGNAFQGERYNQWRDRLQEVPGMRVQALRYAQQVLGGALGIGALGYVSDETFRRHNEAYERDMAQLARDFPHQYEYRESKHLLPWTGVGLNLGETDAVLFLSIFLPGPELPRDTRYGPPQELLEARPFVVFRAGGPHFDNLRRSLNFLWDPEKTGSLLWDPDKAVPAASSSARGARSPRGRKASAARVSSRP